MDRDASLPADLPVPEDDGAADHLVGARVPSLALTAADGSSIDLASATHDATVVVYVYPMTGTPGRSLPAGWNEMPSARGCTPQSCGFRDHERELVALGATVFGLSGQRIDEQREFAAREHIPYPLLNDRDFALATEWGLPTFQLDGVRYYRRLTFIANAGAVSKVFYPVFPPGGNAADVISWLRSAR